MWTNFILAPPSIEKKGLKKVYFVKEADTVTLQCPVKGYPAPIITWLKDSDVIPLHSSPHINFSDGFQKLQLLHATLKDAGTYTCIAGNEIGTDEVDFKLDVQGAIFTCASLFNWFWIILLFLFQNISH